MGIRGEAIILDKFWVKTGARLHLGQLDLNGSLGRLYGGLGLAISKPGLELTAEKNDDLVILAPEKEKVRLHQIAREYLVFYRLPGIKLELLEALPSHSGLGSGTTLALALGLAVTRVYGLEPSFAELIEVTDRESSRSGIGVAAFEQGGFLIDGGKSIDKIRADNFEVPPLLARFPFPEDWGVVLALPNVEEKIFGSEEENAFKSLPPMDIEVSGSICRLLLMKLLPGLIEKDLNSFGEAITEIQRYLGDYFSPVQGGRYSSAVGSQVAEYMLAQGAAGVGQSSWGPIVYGFTRLDKQAELVDKTRSFLGDRGQVWAAQGRNQGANWGWR